MKLVPKDEKVYDLENEGDSVMRTAPPRLFECEIDPIELIKWKVISKRVEEFINVCEDVSNSMEGIVLKNA